MLVGGQEAEQHHDKKIMNVLGRMSTKPMHVPSMFSPGITLSESVASLFWLHTDSRQVGTVFMMTDNLC